MKKDDKYYVAELKDGKFGETGSFTTTPIVKTVNYTLDESIVYFSDHGGEGTSLNYSNGALDTYWKNSDLGAVDAGTYEMTVIQQAGYSAHLYKSTTTTDENKIITFASSCLRRARLYLLQHVSFGFLSHIHPCLHRYLRS